MKEFLTATYELMEAFLMSKLDVVFSSYQRTALYGKLREIIPTFLQSLKYPHLRAANEFYQVEQMKPFTMATAAFQSAQREAFDILKTRRQESRMMRFLESGDNMDGARRVGPSGISDAQMGEDEYAKEIEIMAVSRAYYEIARSRFVDTLRASTRNSSERCMELMVEDPERQKRRRDLKEEEKLKKAMGSLSTI
ncbi:hypothetical protein ACJ73_07123 [Blastomyces percursus]|uniref:GED domain-containing protein n=1 Tax=Blastomyces percursus TaxID=1658174 RepID=A0A1J9PYY6_9EURO|nr:hypothetical protein ACJ73_07123 [Blastomyces percursus]